MRTWEEIKLDGSEHYKWNGIQRIDLLKDLDYCRELNLAQLDALSNIIKYAVRQLQRGVAEKDLEKIIHYAEIAGAAKEAIRE